MRFYGTLKFNGIIVGKGYGSNKKQVKMVAARLALMNLVPTLYREWKNKMEPDGSPPVTEKAEQDSIKSASAHGSLACSVEKDKSNAKPRSALNTPE